MEKIVEIIKTKNIYTSIIYAVVGIIVYYIIKKIINKYIDKNNKTVSKKKKTYIKLFDNIVKYIMIIVVIALILQINGVNVSSIVASLGIVSIIAGLALQDALKDIIMGFNIVLDNYFSVGDVIELDGVIGKVLEIGIKTVKIRNIENGNIYVIGNRNISSATTLSTVLDIDIPLPYEEHIERTEKVVRNIVQKVSELSDVISSEYKGVNEFGESAIYYKIRVNVRPELRLETKRTVNRIIKTELDNENIAIPYTQIDIHSK